MMAEPEFYGAYVEAKHEHFNNSKFGWAVSAGYGHVELPAPHENPWIGATLTDVSLGTIRVVREGAETQLTWMMMTPEAAVELARHLLMAAQAARRNQNVD